LSAGPGGDADRVVIAGAGPAGLTAAALLAEAGVPAVVLEAEPALPTNLRASTFHPPTLDMMDRFGATEALLRQGLIASELQYRDRETGLLGAFDFGEIADVTRHPYRLQCEQYKLNIALAGYIGGRSSVEIRFGAPVSGVEQTADSVAAVLESGERVEGRYLIGAEGARSPVRQALGLPFEGFTWPEAFLVVSTTFPFEERMEGLCWVNYFADPDEWFFLLRAPDVWRAMFPVAGDVSEETAFEPEAVRRHLERACPGAGAVDPKHLTLYRVHQRVAARYREGRAFIAGDAAHINNPLGGMGMNGGIHDAFNLGERLVAVMTGAVAASEADAYLDGYEAERRPVALEYVNEITIRNKRNLETRDPAEQAAFRRMLNETAADPVKRRRFLLRASMFASLGVQE